MLYNGLNKCFQIKSVMIVIRNAKTVHSIHIIYILNSSKKTGEKKNHAHRSEYQQKMEKKKLKRIKNSHHTLIMYAFVPGMNEKKNFTIVYVCNRYAGLVI